MKLKEGYAELVAQEAKLQESRRNRIMNLPQIKPYVNSVAKYIENTQGRPITMHEKRNVAQCLYNCISESAAKGQRLFETTTEDNISFLGVQLPVIAALIPTLVMNKVAVVQALDRRIGAVFYLDVKYGSTKGQVTAGDTMLSSTTGHAESKSGRRYARASVERESLGTGDGAYSGTTDYNPGLINLENVVVEQLVGTTYTTIGTCSAAGVISGSAATGTIVAAGTYSITVSGATSGSTILLSYDYQYDLPTDANGNRDGVPKVDISVTQSAVEAVDYPLRADWSLGAQIDLQKAHGIDLERELVKYLGSEVKFTIDQEGLDRIDTAAASVDSAGTITTWDARPSEGETWKDKKEEFLDRFEEASNLIFDKTKRGVATFAVVGNNVARVLKQLGKDYFTPASGAGKQIPTGPIEIGTLNNQITVIQNPFRVDTNSYTVGFRGDQYLYAGFVYCPYIPLFATPTLTTSDLISQKGFLSSAAFKVINAGLFCQGSIQNLAGGYVKGT